MHLNYHNLFHLKRNRSVNTKSFSGLIQEITQIFNKMTKINWGFILTLTVLNNIFVLARPSDKKIVGGTEARPNELPSMVGVLKKESHICGGSILNKYCCLTAAHCFTKPKSPYLYQFVVGAYNIDSFDEEEYAEKYAVKKIMIHPDYKNIEDGYDLAIICTDKEIEFNKYVQPAILPKGKYSDSCDYASVYGWGTTSDGGYPSDVLLKVDVPTISNTRCELKYRKEGYQIHESQICCGYEDGGKDSCSGDSGGPLVCNSGSHNGTQIGLVSYGIGCAEPEFPGVYTRLSHYTKWINEIINNKY